MCMSKEHTSCCEDKLSSSPDEILIMILDKLDPRTTITTTVLSKRWLDLPRRQYTCYDLSVYEILPPRYHRLKKITMEAKAGYEAEKRAHNLTDSTAFKDKYDRFYAIKDQHEQWMWKVHLVTPILQRYERLAMRRYVKRVNALLLPPNNSQQLSIQKLRLQAFTTSSFDQWIPAAVGRWGVEELEIIIENSYQPYDFRLLDRCQNVRLKRLVLSNCCNYGRTPLFFQRLTTLTMCGLSSRIHIINDILMNCVQLVDLRLKNSPYHSQPYRFNFPASMLKNLQLDNCSIWKIYLTSLPCLETFAFRGRPAKLHYGEVPELRHVSLDFLETGDNGDNHNLRRQSTYALGKFFKGTPPPLEYLVLQLRGHQMWIEPTAIPSRLIHLKKLFVANVPRSWDTFWIFILFAAAPFLQSLQVHFDNNSEKAGAAEPLPLDVQVEQPQQQHLHLRELVVVGFDGAAWQTGFVKRVMRASRWLQRVHLLDGHVVEAEDRGLLDLEVVPCRREWHECERSEVLEELADGTGFPQRKIVLE
ncbi:hypothetical protein QYE76_061269 [Lolium multiflorum]|uniref:F-box domain-containing protein n=1 Tax=Lolium multiflorum TaxID=4521 RepID=A0AAD8S1A6_LOLMU|nr:hypothetical protein QYE76_061269 [Lolium multiflorum]